MPTQPPLRIGARGSRLSLAQAGTIRDRIAQASGGEAELVVITTTGDRIQDRRLLEVGGKALFTKEIEEALLGGRIDCAVHSLKDMPSELPEGLVIAATPEREDVRDAFVSPKFASFDDLPKGARLGTASLRRGAQALHRRPDLEIVMIRGNVDTRLAKLERGEADALILAVSGLKRLGLGDVARELLDPVAFPPAPGQGALAIETRMADAEASWLKALHHGPTALALAAERGALEALEGSCRTAMGAHAKLDGGRLVLTVEALTPDGRERFRREGIIDLGASPEAEARALGLRLGGEVRDQGGERLVLAG